MFRKIVTELAYSPALAGSLGNHIKTLRDERSKRQIGLVFVLLAIVVQLFSTLFPPESANANNPAMFVDDEVRSVDEYLRYYDQNSKNIRDLLASLSITRSDIETAQLAPLPSAAQLTLWSMQNDRGEDTSAYRFRTPDGKQKISFHQTASPQTIHFEGFVGTITQSGKWFALTQKGGNLITEEGPTSDCSSWFSISLDTEPCPSSLQASLSARLIMSNSPTAPEVANASDRIAYTLSITNNGDSSAPISPSMHLEDLLEYSRILDNDGSEYDYDTKILNWPASTLAPQETTERNFIVQLLPVIPSTAKGQYIAVSYDCTIRAVFGSSISIPVDCPLPKTVEAISSSLPETPKAVNLIFAATILIISSYLYACSRQLLTELYIIRHNHLGGL